ncbi:MAG: hypothetical protein J6Z11_04800 [Candidatus Riflebacteria bacterium]|nr:hypothetical protein [Candidatus Riflebacteria bacterium]
MENSEVSRTERLDSETENSTDTRKDNSQDREDNSQDIVFSIPSDYYEFNVYLERENRRKDAERKG